MSSERGKYTSGYFLEIFLLDHEDKRTVIEKLREWAEGYRPKIEIWPVQGISNIIKVICSDSHPLSGWQGTKEEVIAIVERFR